MRAVGTAKWTLSNGSGSAKPKKTQANNPPCRAIRALLICALLPLLAGWGSPKLTLVHPPTVSAGNLLAVAVHADADTVDLAGYGFAIAYEPAVLTLFAVVTTPTFTASYGIGETCLNMGPGEGASNEAREQLALCRVCGGGGVDGEGDLATIYFLAAAPGVSPLAFVSSDMHERDCLSLELESIPHTTEDSSVTVQ